MTEYRTRISILADVLGTVVEYTYGGQKGATITHLIRKANVPHERLSPLILKLKSSGMLLELPDSKYRISEKGMMFLKNYREFKDFADGFGLRL